MHILCNSAVSLLGIYPTDTLACVGSNSHPRTIVAAVLGITKDRKDLNIHKAGNG